MPNVNSGKPWSQVDLADLAYCLDADWSIADIANFLCRDRDEVQAKIAAFRRPR
jgi:hypothetical protein